jgi:NADPH2:quinone reductase
MRAAVISELGRPPELADRPDPSGGAIYEVSAVSLNPIDVNVGAGRHFGGHPELPYVPGCDGLGLSRDGLLAERAAAPADLGIPLPDAVSDEIAASCGIARMAGWMPVAWRAPLREDDRVLVLGATGTVGLVATQVAKLLGAKRVVAVGRNPERLKRAAELGADATLSLEVDDLVAGFKEAAGGNGPTYIVDTLWGPPAAAAIQAAAPGWRLVQIGQSAGAEASLSSAAIRGKMGELYGYTRTSRSPGTSSASSTCASSATRPRARSSSTSRPTRSSGSRRPGNSRSTAPTRSSS